MAGVDDDVGAIVGSAATDVKAHVVAGLDAFVAQEGPLLGGTAVAVIELDRVEGREALAGDVYAAAAADAGDGLAGGSARGGGGDRSGGGCWGWGWGGCRCRGDG
ncbi:MAG TPA: hypothetical protein VM124_00700, partial [Candidatus Limnocylindrales bacterium]|nr:hypothetical protein [Candidatus Limnocylindrales bacterium]